MAGLAILSEVEECDCRGNHPARQWIVPLATARAAVAKRNDECEAAYEHRRRYEALRDERARVAALDECHRWGEVYEAIEASCRLELGKPTSPRALRVEVIGVTPDGTTPWEVQS
jgi:hypothetical protein